MNKIILFFIIFLYQITLSQRVIFNEVVETHKNQDKFLFKIDQNYPNSIYLGEIEIQGFTTNDQELYKEVYHKAKEIGANAISYVPFPSVDSKPQKFNPWNYKLSLYYLPKENFQLYENQIYIYSPKPTTIKINKQIISFPSRTYTKINLEAGQEYTISNRKLFGSSLQFSHNSNQPVKHILISNTKIKTNNQSTDGGFQIKTGDLNILDRSFADFLSIIYQEFKTQVNY